MPPPSLTPDELDACLSACTVGCFQYVLMMIAFIAHNSNSISVSNYAFVTAAAECDLNLNINDRGLLQSMPYFGMVSSGFFAGFFTDTFGRQRTLKYGCMAIFVTMVFESLSQNYIMLATGKFIEGFMVNATFNANLAMVSEFHAKPTRDRMIMLLSSFFSWGQITTALLAWLTLSNNLSVVFVEGVLAFHNWNLYILLGSFWSLAASLLYARFPESPKYLFRQGKEVEAMDVMKKIYVKNTGKSPESYTCANIEIQNMPALASNGKSIKHKMVTSFNNMKPLCHRPLNINLLKIIVLFFMLMMAYNTLRNWYPSISSILEKYKPPPGQLQDNICQILDAYMKLENNKKDNETVGPCNKKTIPARTFHHSIFMGFILLIPYIIGGVLIGFVGKKNLLQGCLLICACCSVGLYWTKTSMQFTTFFSIIVAFTQLAINISQILTIGYFPTAMRTLTISIAMTSGRVGSLFGNNMFPILLSMGCMTPFLAVSGVMLCCCALVHTLSSKSDY